MKAVEELTVKPIERTRDDKNSALKIWTGSAGRPEEKAIQDWENEGGALDSSGDYDIGEFIGEEQKTCL